MYVGAVGVIQSNYSIIAHCHTGPGHNSTGIGTATDMALIGLSPPTVDGASRLVHG